MKRGWQTILVVALMAGLLGFALVTYILADKKPSDPAAQIQNTAQTAAQQAEQPGNTQPAGAEKGSVSDVIGGSQGIPGQQHSERWTVLVPRIIVRLALATLLAALLAFRPRRDLPLRQRNLYVAQTQILLAVVASALMMIVGDNAARAFGIFAAVSLVRFRTNIKDPKEITVLLVSLAIGLATGVGRWELGIIMALFVLLLLWGLEYRESEMVSRAMELTVKTRNIGTTQDALLQLFRRYDFAAEMRTIDRPDGEDEAGCIIYYVDVSQQVSTDRLSEELLAADPRNIDSVQWDQQKNTSYFYQ